MQDLCSYIQPVVQAFKMLQLGKLTFDQYRKEEFIYRAHLTHIIGDTPAISKLMGIKGVNSQFPCRTCKIKSQKGPSNTYYPTIHPPDEKAHHFHQYNPYRLPTWSNKSFKDIANEVSQGKKWITDETGVKYKSPILDLSSIIVPWCFCIDAMHLILENLVASHWKDLLGNSSPEFSDVNKVGNDVINKYEFAIIENEFNVSLEIKN